MQGSVFASVVFLKVQELARRPVSEQTRLRAQLEAVVAVTTSDIDPAGCIVLDASDGVAIVVLRDPMGALRLAGRALAATAAGLPLSAGLNPGAGQLSRGRTEGMAGDALPRAPRGAEVRTPPRVLARGAMGIVYRAEDPALDRVVALKTILLAEDAEGRQEYHKRFFQEAKAAGKLTHPHIVTTYDFGEEEGLAYMAMELLEGTELRTRMREGVIPPAEAIDIARQIADGLGFAHERGVVHRDIKPGNIMILARGQVNIMDFGIARMRQADFKTSTGMVLGTPKYMSPEQIAGEPVDHRSDLFSLGIVLYEMLTGTRLFAGEDVPQITHNVTNVEH